MILCVGATPAAQRVMVFERLVPDRVNRAITALDGAAGKAVNVAKVLKVLGEDTLVTGFCGGDRGAQLRAILEACGVAMEFLEVPALTRQCTTVLDQHAGTVTELVEESRPVTAADYDRLLEVVRRHAPRCRAIVLSGTITPGGPADFYRQCTRVAKAAGCLAVVDAQGPLLLESLKAGPDLVKPNRTELTATVGGELADEPAALAALRRLHERGARQIVVTDGARPGLASDGRSCWRIFPPSIQAVNPIGSGDACTAGIVSRLVRGKALGEACRCGLAAGAANALTMMAGEVRLEDVTRLAASVRVERIE